MFWGVVLACKVNYGKYLKIARKYLKKEQNVRTKRNVSKFHNIFEKYI